MKLILCEKCNDIRSLRLCLVECSCKQSWGFYLKDGINAEIGGAAIPIGFDNYSLIRAIQNRPDSGMGREFRAFIIPVSCNTVKENRE